MSLLQKEKSASPTARCFESVPNDQNWDTKQEDFDLSSRDIKQGVSMARRRSYAITHLEERLSQLVYISINEWLEAFSNIDPHYSEDERESKSLDISTFDDNDAHTLNELEDSPYPEVRAAVKNYHEDVHAETIRAWTIGIFLVVFGASMNTFFSLRSPSIGLGALIAQIIAWPLGHG